MDYRFEISMPHGSDFRCEIAVGGEQTFQQFHDKIVETLHYDKSQMASFFTLDKMGNRVAEIVLMDMATGDPEQKLMVMDSTKISDVIKPGCMELEYVYDFFNNKFFRVEFAGRYDGDGSTKLPVCLYCEGEIPRQTSLDEAADDWSLDDADEADDYDDSFMDEFDNDGYLDEEEDGYGSDYDEDGYSRGGIRYERLDDYIDKI